MAYSFTRTTGDGITIAFPFSFVGESPGYLSVDDIHVYVDFVEVAFTLTSPSTLSLSVPPALGDDVLIRRIQNKSLPYSNFARGSNFNKDTMNKSFLHMLYIQHEAMDGFQDALTYLQGDLDMGGHQVTNLGEGEDDADAVTKAYADLISTRVSALEASSDLIGFGSFWKQSFISTEGQTVFVHSVETPIGLGLLDVYISGVYQIKGAFTETDSYTVELSEALPAGVLVELRGIKSIAYSSVVSPTIKWRELYTVGVGGQTVFTHPLPTDPSANLLFVYVNGVYQQSDAFVETDQFTVTMSETIPEGSTVEIRGEY